MNLRKFFTLVVCLFVWPTAINAVTDTVGLDVDTSPLLQKRMQQIRSNLANSDSWEMEFREERTSQILSEPAIYSGQLTYNPTTRTLSKILQQPQSTTFTMDDAALKVVQGSKTRKVSLRSRPALRGLLIGFRALIEGDTHALDKYFLLTYTERPTEWQLTMTPRAKRLAKRLKVIEVLGHGEKITRIATTMGNGDQQKLFLLP